jgi:O-antigen ligase
VALPDLKDHARTGAQWCAVAIGFTIPISVALDNVLLVVLIVLWLLSSDLAGRLRRMRDHAVSSMALVFAATMLIGVIWSTAPAAHLHEALIDALRFILVGLFAGVFLDASTRDRAQFAFLLSSTVVLVLSFATWAGITDPVLGLKGSRDNPVVFKYHITHSLLMACAAFLFALHAMEARNRSARAVLWGVAAAATINVFLMVPGRTGQLALAAAITYLAIARFRKRGAAIAVLGLAALTGVAALTPGSVLHRGGVVALKESAAWEVGKPQPTNSSVGTRLEYYRNALELIAERPVIGFGSGAFRSAYEAKVRGTSMSVPPHPHNAFLHAGVELGLIGLAVLVALLVVQWRSAGTLNNFTDRVAARGFLVIFIVALLVSLSFGDHTEGWFYAWASGLFFANARWPSNARA